jgi:hypothetical protein
MLLACFLMIFGHATQNDEDVIESPVRIDLYRPVTHGPTLTEITVRESVRASNASASGVVTLVAPSNYSGQVVVSLDVHCEPKSAMKGWIWRDRDDHVNSVIQAQISPAETSATVWYTAMVLNPSEPVPRTMQKEFHPWLKSTACIQSGDQVIKGLATRLAAGVKNRAEFVHRVVMWVAKNHSKQNSLGSWDAKNGLSGGGSANRAALCAALLRADGVAARTMAYMPTWANGQFSEQWLTEYWSEVGSWEMVDPTIGVFHPGRNSAVVLAISSPEDEEQAFDKTHLRANPPGCPFLSSAEVTQGLKVVSPIGGPINEVHLLKTFPNRSESLILPSGYRRSLKVLHAAKHGQSAQLHQNEVIKAAASGTFAFATLLDGKVE